MVFATVNVACLVLRRDRATPSHFRAPTAIPVLATACCAYPASPLSDRALDEYLVAAPLLGMGLLLWALNRMVIDRA